MSAKSLKDFPSIKTDSESLEDYKHDMVYEGAPEAIHMARDWQDTSEILEFCDSHQTPVTFCGSQTAMTGSSVADSGLVVALANKNKILDIGKDSQTSEPFVITEPGVILGDLKRKVLEEGYQYPPDPTSYNEAQVGATVATNATGEETFRFGPTRWYVKELEILRANGKAETITRKGPPPSEPVKNSAGYFLGGEPIDDIIGSEGTLALITKLKLKLLPDDSPGRFLLILPFDDFASCLDGVLFITSQNELNPRALELIGPGAGEYFRECESCPGALKKSSLFLYIRDDYKDDVDKMNKLETWFQNLERLYQSLGQTHQMNDLFLAETPQQLSDIRECRHHIPLRVNETYFPYTKLGGGKVGTDWWVPLNHMKSMMLETYEEASRSGLPFLTFAHIGNGHPHWNFLTKTPEEKKIAQALVEKQYHKAVKHGGGVAGEHGIGKIKRHLIGIQHNQETIDQMKALKNKWDPHHILGQGNILKS
jgi:FAD/FMN-containing dehydrogenase